MPVGQVEVKYMVFVCDGPGCEKHANYDATPAGEQEAIKDNPWLENVRYVVTRGQKRLAYCGDICEVNAIGANKHVDGPEIQAQANQAQIQALATASQRSQQVTAALKSGAGSIKLA